jgi:hypothetical protein
MKKLAIAFATILALIGIVPAQAETAGAVAIIDVSFESTLISGEVTEICLAAPSVCSSAPTPRNTSQFKAFNHGTIMADVARSNNADVPLVLIEAGIDKTGVITGIQLSNALNWVIANSDKYNIKAVSFSYNAGKGSSCTPASPGVNILTTHNNVVNAIAVLKASKIDFYASSGNYGSGNNIDYPACISDSVAVGSTQFAGSTQRSDLVLSGNAYTSKSLKSIRTAVQGLHDSFPITTTGPNPFMVGFTTSVATVTAAVASVPTVKAKAPEPTVSKVVGVIAETPATTSTVSSRQLLLGSLDSSVSLIQKVRANAASTDTIDRASASELAKTLRDLASQLDSVYNN